MTKEVFQLEVQVTTTPALTGLNQIDAKLKQVKDSADKVGKGNSFGNLTSQTGALTSSLKTLGGVIAGLAFGKVASDAVSSMVAFQNLETVLTTVAGGVTQAATAMKLLQDVSAVTPFSINQLGDSFIKLKAAGLEPTAAQLKLFSDVASVTTDKVGSLQAITDLYARTTAGGLGLEELNRLADRGIPVFDILSKRIGVNRLGLSELGKSAEGARLIIKNLEAGLSTAFGGASAKSLNTLDGQFGQFKKNLEGLAVTAGQAGATDGLTALVKSLNELTTALQPIANVLGGAIGDGLKVMAAGIAEATTNTLKLTAAAAALAAGIVVLPAILNSVAGNMKLVYRLFSYDLGLVTNSLPKMPRTLPAKLDTNLDKVKYLAISQGEHALGTASEAAAVGVDKLFAALGRVWTMATTAFAAMVRFVGLGFMLNPVGAAITAIVATLFIFRNTLVKVGEDSASVGEIIIYPFKKLYEWAGKAVEGIKEVVVGMVEFFSIKPPAWLIGLKDWALGGIVKDISDARKAKEATDKESERAANRAIANAQEQADIEKKKNDDAKLAQDLMTGRASTLLKILDSLRQESSLIGKTKQDAEILTKEYELQNSIKQKLLSADPTLTSDQLEAKAVLSVIEKRQIANEVYKKYQATSLAYFNDMLKGNNLEISLLGASNNERDKANKLREIQVQLGMNDAQWSKEKLKYETEINRTQDARINDSLSKNLKGIQLETEYLKLGNDERERKIALDQAAADAGFKNAQELSKARPQAAAKISEAIGVKQQTKVDVAARDQIRDLKEESALLSKLNEKDREREKAKQDIYKAIDPEGRGKKINQAQKNEIENLLATIEAQNKLLEVNKKIDDGFATLGDAVSNWALGTEGSIKRVRLALLQLATLAAFKYFAGGVPTGAGGSFISGVLGGLSGARAEGGPVEAGKSYLVGEKRPEVFVPTQNGYIVPNPTMMNTSTGATHVTMSPNLIIQGSVTGQSELENMFDQFSSAMANETQKFVINQLGQNGILAR